MTKVEMARQIVKHQKKLSALPSPDDGRVLRLAREKSVKALEKSLQALTANA